MYDLLGQQMSIENMEEHDANSFILFKYQLSIQILLKQLF